ncbi:MAG: host-nuclease inhibitor Gam family protein, partial [Lachnospiraceae bacterium]|nr:host-nuclease inhibitor Gam family protein [Lachnospiraceae bacterium]
EKLKSETGYLKGMLFGYFEKVEHKATKTQETYRLLDGSLVFKLPQRKIVQPENNAELVKYLKDNAPMLVETIEKPAWGEFKKNLTLTDDGVVDTTTGEKLDFIKTEESEGSFEVKVG